MKKYILPIFLCLTFACYGEYSGQYVIEGGSKTPYLAKDDANNDIKVYLLNGLEGAKITFTSTSSPGTHKWYKYTNNANGATEINDVNQTGNTSYITDISNGTGYYVGDPANMSTSYVWIIDYSKYIPIFNSIDWKEYEDKCERIILLFDVDASKMTYNTPVNGTPLEIFRKYTLGYSTMVWNNDNKMFMNEFVEKELSGPLTEYPIDPAPLKNTDFVLSGDQFAEYFGKGKTKKTLEYEAIAVQAQIVTDSIASIPDNQISGNDGSISAPANFTYTAYANEPVATFFKWKIYNLDKSTTEPVSQSTAKILHYTFEDPGHYRVDLEVSDYQSVCTYFASIQDITVSDFMLWVPNAFSPASSPGVNDIFKVSYKSVVKFNGWIFNRWGNELFHWSDPTQGWDGKYHGKYVPPGTYFYVIEATDSNGKKHVKKGDVNIVGGK